VAKPRELLPTMSNHMIAIGTRCGPRKHKGAW